MNMEDANKVAEFVSDLRKIETGREQLSLLDEFPAVRADVIFRLTTGRKVVINIAGDKASAEMAGKVSKILFDNHTELTRQIEQMELADAVDA